MLLHTDKEDIITNSIHTSEEDTTTKLYRGDVYIADLGEDAGDKQSWLCPVVIVQNDVSYRYSSRTIIVPITDLFGENISPSHIPIRSKDSKLQKDSVIVCEEIRAIDASRLKERISSLNDDYISKLNMALAATLGLDLIVFQH